MSNTAIVVVEVAKVLLSGYFSYVKQNGLTDDEIKELYETEKAAFNTNDPAALEDV